MVILLLFYLFYIIFCLLYFSTFLLCSPLSHLFLLSKLLNQNCELTILGSLVSSNLTREPGLAKATACACQPLSCATHQDTCYDHAPKGQGLWCLHPCIAHPIGPTTSGIGQSYDKRDMTRVIGMHRDSRWGSCARWVWLERSCRILTYAPTCNPIRAFFCKLTTDSKLLHLLASMLLYVASCWVYFRTCFWKTRRKWQCIGNSCLLLLCVVQMVQGPCHTIESNGNLEHDRWLFCCSFGAWHNNQPEKFSKSDFSMLRSGVVFDMASSNEPF